MEQSQETPSPEYIKGFNQGYLLARHTPELIEKLPADLGNSERSLGLKEGKEQYEAEKEKERTPAWMKKDAFSDLDKDNKDDKTKDKDDLDRE